MSSWSSFVRVRHDHFNEDNYGRIFILVKVPTLVESVEKEVSRFQRRLLQGSELLEGVKLAKGLI